MSDTPLYDQTCEEHGFDPLDIQTEHIRLWSGQVVRSIEIRQRR